MYLVPTYVTLTIYIYRYKCPENCSQSSSIYISLYINIYFCLEAEALNVVLTLQHQLTRDSNHLKVRIILQSPAAAGSTRTQHGSWSAARPGAEAAVARPALCCCCDMRGSVSTDGLRSASAAFRPCHRAASPDTAVVAL